MPAGNRPRQFQLLYRLPAGVKLEYLEYGGVSLNTEVGLSPIRGHCSRRLAPFVGVFGRLLHGIRWSPAQG